MSNQKLVEAMAYMDNAVLDAFALAAECGMSSIYEHIAAAKFFSGPDGTPTKDEKLVVKMAALRRHDFAVAVIE